MLSTLQSGSEVLTTGGIVGTIVNITGDMLILRVKPDNIKLQVARSAVAEPGQRRKSPRGKEVNVIHEKQLKFRVITIVAVILICLYGIIGLPTSKAELIDELA